MIRAKFQVLSVDNRIGGAQNIEAQPVMSGSKENESFSKWTPGGHLKLQITNPDAQNFFKPGMEFFLDMTAVNDTQAAS